MESEQDFYKEINDPEIVKQFFEGTKPISVRPFVKLLKEHKGLIDTKKKYIRTVFQGGTNSELEKEVTEIYGQRMGIMLITVLTAEVTIRIGQNNISTVSQNAFGKALNGAISKLDKEGEIYLKGVNEN